MSGNMKITLSVLAVSKYEGYSSVSGDKLGFISHPELSRGLPLE